MAGQGFAQGGRLFEKGRFVLRVVVEASMPLPFVGGPGVGGHEFGTIEELYHPLEARLRSLRQRHAAEAENMALIELIQKEIDIYRQYSAYYGNAFFVMRRR